MKKIFLLHLFQKNKKFIYYDPKKNQIDINKLLIVTNKKFMEKNNQNLVSINQQNLKIIIK